MIDTISQFRVRYAVEIDDESQTVNDAVDYVKKHADSLDFHETSQNWLGHTVYNSKVYSQMEYIEEFNNENPGGVIWTNQQKLNCVNKIK